MLARLARSDHEHVTGASFDVLEGLRPVLAVPDDDIRFSRLLARLVLGLQCFLGRGADSRRPFVDHRRTLDAEPGCFRREELDGE